MQGPSQQAARQSLAVLHTTASVINRTSPLPAPAHLAPRQASIGERGAARGGEGAAQTPCRGPMESILLVGAGVMRLKGLKSSAKWRAGDVPPDRPGGAQPSTPPAVGRVRGC